jgi:hypothetical protein
MGWQDGLDAERREDGLEVTLGGGPFLRTDGDVIEHR